MVCALPPDQSCSNLIKTNAFLIQGPKSTVKVMVSATTVGGQQLEPELEPEPEPEPASQPASDIGIAPKATDRNHWPPPKLPKRHKNPCFFDPRLQKHSKHNGFGVGPRSKLLKRYKNLCCLSKVPKT